MTDFLKGRTFQIFVKRSNNQNSVNEVKFNTYKTITLPVVLYGCENLFFKLRDGKRLRDF